MTRSLHPDSAWPLSAEATGQVDTCHPPKKQGILPALVHRAATIPVTLPGVQLITSWGQVLASPCLLHPPRGCVLQGQPSLRAEPLGTNASHVPWDTVCLCSPLALQGLCLEGLFTRPFQPRFLLNLGGRMLPPSPVTVCHWEPL